MLLLRSAGAVTAALQLQSHHAEMPLAKHDFSHAAVLTGGWRSQDSGPAQSGKVFVAWVTLGCWVVGLLLTVRLVQWPLRKPPSRFYEPSSPKRRQCVSVTKAVVADSVLRLGG